MATRLQELVWRLKIPDENHVVLKYIASYVTKEKIPRIISDTEFPSLLDQSTYKLTSEKWYRQNGNFDGFIKECYVSAHGPSSSSVSGSRGEVVDPVFNKACMAPEKVFLDISLD